LPGGDGITVTAPLKVLLIYASGALNQTYSYQTSWPRHFQRHPRFQCTMLNLMNRDWTRRIRAHTVAQLWRGDAIVILHSAFSNACFLTGRLFDSVASRREPKAYFIGNEYKLMPEKMEFAERLGLTLLVSQSTLPEVHAVYRERLRCAVAGIPNTGLDTSLFFPASRAEDRPIDLGFRSVDSAMYLGHRERRDIAEYFQAQAARFDLRVDISLEERDRFSEKDWAGFLNRCKGQLGTEAGGDYFELDDRTRLAVNDRVRTQPDLTLAEVRRTWFSEPRPVSMRILSGRNVEAAGTRTAQLLFEGRYDGYLEPDVHYIPLKKDCSNADEAVRKFKDAGYRERLVENAYQLARAEFTYPHLIDRFDDAFRPLL
jgi:hypothetical protein